MIFEKQDIALSMLDVLLIDQAHINQFNSGRNMDALSFRIEGDTVLKTETAELYAGSNSVLYAPARVDYTRISKRDKMIVIHFNALNFSGTELECIYLEKPEKLFGLFAEILDVWEKKRVGYKQKATAILYLIFEELYIEKHREREIDPRIEKGASYIFERFSDVGVSVTNAARISNVSEVYFRRIFKELYGISPKKQIIELRIKRAVALIESGYYTLSEISEMCGFEDYKYFSTEFHRILGVPPSKYSYLKEKDRL